MAKFRDSVGPSLLILFCIWSGTALRAQPTCQTLQNSVIELEAVKYLLASGDYDNFFEFVSAKTSNEIQTRQFVEELKRVFPEGFLSCSTVMSEMKSPRIIEELVIFEGEGELPFFLYWLVAVFKEERQEVQLLSSLSR